LNGTENAKTDIERVNTIRENIKALMADETKNNGSLDYEISEMFTGRTYILFRYQTLKDIRIVYNPPLAIGEFGGETDNWVWPRHNGDFCILRAYVGPDGKPASYSTSNIPYHPKKFLKVNAKGVKENDFVFILGYPGTTFRHMPSQFIEYQQNYQLPFIADLFEWQIALMEKLSKGGDSKALFYASKIKGLANTSKNYRGKLQGLERTHLIDKKGEYEKQMMEAIKDKPGVKNVNGTLFEEISSSYTELFERAWKSLWFQRIYTSVNLMDAASDYAYLKTLYAENDSLKIKRTKEGINGSLAMYNEEAELPTLAHMIYMALQFPKEQHIGTVDSYFSGMDEEQIMTKLKKMIEGSIMNDRAKVKESMDSTIEIKASDEFLKFNQELNKEYDSDQAFFAVWRPKVAGLIKRYNDLEMLVNENKYIPDANSTLRLTYGYIKGYSPQDAVYHKPFTTLKGILEKETATGDFVMPPLLKEIIEKRDYGQWYDKTLDDVAVALLYNLDTTGGNSGSPVMDAYGNFIGINFDRAYTATINDYAWNENYSRSIGCDARYICFILDKYSHAEALLKEMGVK
jgi:hypothetical protein